MRDVTGQYFANRKPKPSSKASYDVQAAARLWQVSAALAGIDDKQVRPQEGPGE